MPLTLDNATKEELRAYPQSAQLLFGQLAERCFAVHGLEAVPGKLAMRAFCACGYSSIGNGGALCSKLSDLEVLDLSSDADIEAWLTKARALRAALDLAAAAVR